MPSVGKEPDIQTLDHAFEHVQIGLSLINESTVIERVNAAGARIMRGAPEDIVGRPFVDLAHPDDVGPAVAELVSLVELGHAGPIVVRVRRLDGEWISIRAHATLLPGERVLGFVVFEDVTEELEVASKLRVAEEASGRRAVQQEAVAEVGRVALSGVAPDVVAQTACELVLATLGVDHAGVYFDREEPEGLLLVAAAGIRAGEVGVARWPRDAGWLGLLERRRALFIDDLLAVRDDLPGADPGDIEDSGLRGVVTSPVVPTRARPGALVAARSAPGGFSREDATFLEGLANVLASSLDSAKALEELRYQALHDGLTGLPNRLLLVDHLELALRQSVRRGTQVAVFVCDLDRFKVVNDGLGHAVGDAVLQTVAGRLAAHVRPGDTVGRFGGDEFVIVCPDVSDLPTVVSIAERLSAAISQPMEVNGTRLVVTGSLGIALAPGDVAEGAAGLVRDADAAMYRAKSHGRSRYELYDDAMRELASRRFRLEADLRRALAEDELVVHFQPVVTADEGELVGVETLVRWQHPEQGLVPPLEFLPVAEEAGLLPAIGDTVIRKAIAQVSEWTADSTWPRHWVAVNLHARELGDDSLLRRLDDVIETYGIDPTLLRMEITEDAILEDTVEAAVTLEALRRRGICISVDDFGTGYSSLAYLKRLPVDSLKLDRVFVDGLADGPESSRPRSDDEVDDTAIASAVVQMAAALRLQVVAEGVETEEQLAVLRRLGCDMVQGFLIARPMPPDELAAWVRRRLDQRS